MSGINHMLQLRELNEKKKTEDTDFLFLSLQQNTDILIIINFIECARLYKFINMNAV